MTNAKIKPAADDKTINTAGAGHWKQSIDQNGNPTRTWIGNELCPTISVAIAAATQAHGMEKSHNANAVALTHFAQIECKSVLSQYVDCDTAEAKKAVNTAMRQAVIKLFESQPVDKDGFDAAQQANRWLQVQTNKNAMSLAGNLLRRCGKFLAVQIESEEGLKTTDTDYLYSVPAMRVMLEGTKPESAKPAPGLEELKAHLKGYILKAHEVSALNGSLVAKELVQAINNIAAEVISELQKGKDLENEANTIIQAAAPAKTTKTLRAAPAPALM